METPCETPTRKHVPFLKQINRLCPAVSFLPQWWVGKDVTVRSEGGLGLKQTSASTEVEIEDNNSYRVLSYRSGTLHVTLSLILSATLSQRQALRDLLWPASSPGRI